MAQHQKAHRPTKGFKRASNLVARQIRSAGETRGFAEARLLTHWAEIAGADMAAMCRPVEVKHPKGTLGATLVVLTTGSHAPLLQAQLPKLRDKVNACYGYAAIGQIRITQTAATGFADGKVAFAPAPKPAAARPSEQVMRAARDTAAPVHDGDLKAALERLGQNVLSKSSKMK